MLALFIGLVLVIQIPVRAQMEFWRAYKAALQEQGKRLDYFPVLLMAGLLIALPAPSS